MKQSEILYYARKHCNEMEYQYEQMYQESQVTGAYGDPSLLARAREWQKKWMEINTMLINEWEKETVQK